MKTKYLYRLPQEWHVAAPEPHEFDQDNPNRLVAREWAEKNWGEGGDLFVKIPTSPKPVGIGKHSP